MNFVLEKKEWKKCVCQMWVVQAYLMQVFPGSSITSLPLTWQSWRNRAAFMTAYIFLQQLPMTSGQVFIVPLQQWDWEHNFISHVPRPPYQYSYGKSELSKQCITINIKPYSTEMLLLLFSVRKDMQETLPSATQWLRQSHISDYILNIFILWLTLTLE